MSSAEVIDAWVETTAWAELALEIRSDRLSQAGGRVALVSLDEVEMMRAGGLDRIMVMMQF